MRGLIMAVAALAGGAHAVSLTRLAEAYNPDGQPVESANLISLEPSPDQNFQERPDDLVRTLRNTSLND